MLNNKSILITGGTGSLGKALVRRIITLKNCDQIYKLEQGKLNLEKKQVNIHK